jgi:hypothetical protein
MLDIDIWGLEWAVPHSYIRLCFGSRPRLVLDGPLSIFDSLVLVLRLYLYFYLLLQRDAKK